MNNLNYSTIMMVATLLVSSAEASSVKKDITRFVSKNGALIAGALAGAVVGVAVLARKNSTQNTTPPKSPEVIVAPKRKAMAKTAKPAQSLFSRSKAWVKNNPVKSAGIAAGVVGVVAAGVGAKHYFASSIQSEAVLIPAGQPEIAPSSTEPQAQSGNGTTPDLSTKVESTSWTTGQKASVAGATVGGIALVGAAGRLGWKCLKPRSQSGVPAREDHTDCDDAATTGPLVLPSRQRDWGSDIKGPPTVNLLQFLIRFLKPPRQAPFEFNFPIIQYPAQIHFFSPGATSEFATSIIDLTFSTASRTPARTARRSLPQTAYPDHLVGLDPAAITEIPDTTEPSCTPRTALSDEDRGFPATPEPQAGPSTRDNAGLLAEAPAPEPPADSGTLGAGTPQGETAQKTVRRKKRGGGEDKPIDQYQAAAHRVMITLHARQ